MKVLRKFFLLAVIIWLGLGVALNLITDYWWYQAEGYQNIFLGILSWRLVTFSIMFFVNILLVAALTYPLLRFSRQRFANNKYFKYFNDYCNKYFPVMLLKMVNKNNFLTVIFWVAVLIFSFFLAISWNYLQVASFFKQVTFGLQDPIFKQDISFYFFSLPLIKSFWGLLGRIIFLVTFLACILYSINGELTLEKIYANRISRYLQLLIALLFFWISGKFLLACFELLYSPQGVVFGAGYTDIHGNLLAMKVSAVLLAFIAIFFILNIFMKLQFKLKIPFIIVTVFIFIINVIYPLLMQKFLVSPNEVAKETTFIEHNIKYTNYAYKLDQAKIKTFDYQKDNFNSSLLRDKNFLDTIRVWDPSPLKQTYQQLQGIRLYYEFNDIDMDRYRIDDINRGMIVSVRELANWKIPQKARTWVNEKLKYTHGYGVVANHMSLVQDNGMPKFAIQDIPPQSQLFKITRPQIYFGELTNDYVIVNTGTQEFDYPKGDQNSYTSYTGKSGVVLDSWWKRLLFAAKFNDLKILISSYLQPQSRILYHRNILQRISKIMPWLYYDRDPYIVIRQDGSLCWLIDAYTVSDKFPYSEPYSKGLNYIRNAVKVVVDAYTGKVDYYIADMQDPLLKTFSSIVPQVFKPIAELPTDLKEHLRYPEQFFYIQAKMYQQYHVKDPGVFYNMEDLWNFPQETYGEQKITVSPRYMFIKEGQLKYVLAIPFTPNRKDNMISYLYADCDESSLSLIKFPKDKLIYGPMQIEARIDQHPDISKELTLWSQKGSQVIRGNLLVLPLVNNILYIEPIYLQAEQSKMPELKRIVAAMGDKIVMKKDLQEALAELLNESISDSQQNVTKSIKQLITEVYDIFIKTESAARQLQWSDFGKGMERLKNNLKDLQDKLTD